MRVVPGKRVGLYLSARVAAYVSRCDNGSFAANCETG
jgi:hypothetical protein